MADTVESTPVDTMEGQILKEKTCDAPVIETTEKGDSCTKECKGEDTTSTDNTDDAHETGLKRKSDDAENEDDDAKKVKKDETEEETSEDKTDGVINGSKADNKTDDVTDGEEKNGKTHDDDIPEDEVVKKVVDDEEEAAPVEDVTASS
jgi:hypothetical protein